MISSSDILNSKVLIVDDQEANVRLLERILRGAGYASVASTMDPRGVCELHRQNRYDLILLDLQMPGMDGFQVMEGLKEIETEGYLPVLVITAEPGHKLRALQAGAKDFISKPLDLAEVRARAYNMLEVRLLHMETKKYSKVLERTVRELEASREVIRLKDLEERKKLDQELALAEETQKSLLPHCLPQFENFRIHAFNNPTRYVGGDFYDFLQLSSGDWVGVLADVSGKGMGAALLSSMVLGALSMEFHNRTQPQEVLNRINRLLCEKSLPYQFVTLFLFLLSPQGLGQFISAGHNPAYLFRIRHVIEAVHFRLQFEQQLGVAHVLAQPGRHRGRILEQTRKDAAVSCDDRILRIKHVKRCRTVVGVDDPLNAVPHVVNGIVAEKVMGRVGKAV